MSKQYSSVAEMILDMSEDKELGKRMAQDIEDRTIVNLLLATRFSQGLSQSYIAEKIGCSQSWVSKFESSKDADLRIGDVQAYAKALGVKCKVVIDG